MIHRSKSNRLYPADLLEKEMNKISPEFELYCEPFIEVGKPHWAFDNYRLNGSLEGASHLFFTQPGWGSKFDRSKSKCVTYACDPEIHKPIDVEKIYDVGFIGELSDDVSDRREILELISSRYNCFLSNDIETKDISKIYSSCKVIFNHIRTEEINIRFFEGLALGAQVCSHTPSLHYFAKEGEHYLSFRTPDEAIQKIDFLIKNNHTRESMARNARSHALKFHTYKHRAKEMVSFLK